MEISLEHCKQIYQLEFQLNRDQKFAVEFPAGTVEGRLVNISENEIWLKVEDSLERIKFARDGEKIFIALNGHVYEFELPATEARHPGHGGHTDEPEDKICAPMPGKILKIFVEEGQQVALDERLFIVEAMKMENEIKAPRAGTVKRVNFAVNDLVSVGQPIIEIEFAPQNIPEKK